MLPLWARGCNLITGLSLGKGLDAGVGMLFPGRVRWGSGTPPSFGALYLLPPPHWEKSVDGGVRAHVFGWLPWSFGKRSVGYASLLLAPGAKGTKAAVVVLCLEAAPPKSRWEEGRGRN